MKKLIISIFCAFIFCTQKDYIVISTCGEFAFLLNITEDENDNSVNIILVQKEKNNKVKVIKDEALIKSIVSHMLKKAY